MGKTAVTPSAVVKSYRRDRAKTRAAGMPWRVFIRCWLESWRIAFRTISTDQARSEARLWAWTHPKLARERAQHAEDSDG